jgi:hypothetical protein
VLPNGSANTSDAYISNGDSRAILESLTEPPSLYFGLDKHAVAKWVIAIVLLDIVIPYTLFYALLRWTRIDYGLVIDIATFSYGLAEFAQCPIRGFRLCWHRDKYAPLGQTSRWAFDSLFWLYIIAFVLVMIPASTVTFFAPPTYWFLPISPCAFLIFACPLFIATVFPFHLPFRIDSDPVGTLCKPAIYYVIENLIAVDWRQGREFRQEWRARYDFSPAFRKLLRELTLWWAIGAIFYMLGLTFITFAGLEFQRAFGASLGCLYLFVTSLGLVSWFWTRKALREERIWLRYRKITQPFP